MSSFLSLGAHVAGMIALSMFLSDNYHWDFYQKLNKNINATGILHETFDRFVDTLSIFFPSGGDLGMCTLLQAMVYLAAALYAFYWAR